MLDPAFVAGLVIVNDQYQFEEWPQVQVEHVRFAVVLGHPSEDGRGVGILGNELSVRSESEKMTSNPVPRRHWLAMLALI